MLIELNSFLRQSKNWLIKTLLEVGIVNKKVRRIYKANWAKSQLKAYLRTNVSFKDSFDNDDKLLIWQYWEGQNIPILVRGCLDSVANYYPKRKLLNFSSLEHYINLPGFYFDYLKRGKIKPAGFSDVVRAYLLKEHGGIWLDATIYLTSYLPDWLTKSPLFWFQARELEDLDGLNLASYCLRSIPHHPIFEMLVASIDAYWKNNQFTLNYFWFLHLLTMLTHTNIGRDCIKNMPFFSFIPVERLQWELLNPYTKERWNQLKLISTIHKLSYKPKVLGWNKDKNLKGTFYEFLFGKSNF